ncbi:Uncharacterised protein [Salmonella enterica subsp. enterica serovar Pullorum]|nr:Uncharacterised protein [Salmonella enterica subsp. enterica serovar Pullorum]
MPPQATFTTTSCSLCSISRDSKRTSFSAWARQELQVIFSILIMTSLFVGSCRVNGILIHSVGILFSRQDHFNFAHQEYVG